MGQSRRYDSSGDGFRGQSTRSPDEIRARIERTRADLDQTVDQLHRRLAPEQLLSQAFDVIRDHAGDVGRKVVKAVRDNPIPIALIGIGAVWLIISETTGRGSIPLRRRKSRGRMELRPASDYDDLELPSEFEEYNPLPGVGIAEQPRRGWRRRSMPQRTGKASRLSGCISSKRT